jgi:hypothetical protein
MTPLSRFSTKLKPILPFITVAAILFSLRWIRLGGIGGYGPPEVIPFADMLYRIFLQPLKLLVLPINRTLFEPIGLLSTIIISTSLLAPLVLAATVRHWRVIAFSVGAIILSMLPTAHLGVLEWRLESSRFLYIPSIFFAFLLAPIFTLNQMQGWRQRVIPMLMIIYLSSLLLCVHQNNFAWRDAGKLVQVASASTEQLIERHNGDWGETKRKLLVFNVPGCYMGAATFINGLPPMLRLRFGDELDGVKVEVIYSGIQTQETIKKTELNVGNDTVIWFFDDRTWTFVEYMALK